MPATFTTTQRSSIPSIEAAPFIQEQPMTAALIQEPVEAEIEATTTTTMLPVNHVIQYSPRTASAPDWTASVQLYQNQQIEAAAFNQEHTQSQDSFKIDSASASETQFEPSLPVQENQFPVQEEEPMEVDSVTCTNQNVEKTCEIDQITDNLTAKITEGTADEAEETNKKLVKQSCHENQSESFTSCPLYPHKTASLLVTTEVQVQLDHDQNLNSAGAMPPCSSTLQTLKGDSTNIPPIVDANVPAGVTMPGSEDTEPAGASSPNAHPRSQTPTGSTTSKTPSPRPRTSVSKQNSTNMDTTEAAATSNNENSASKCSPQRGPVPTPRKSVTMMEVDSNPQPVRSNSAMGNHKKISFSSNNHMPVSKKHSTFSLHNTSAIEEDSGSNSETEQPLQRRNSIHNVPFVDVSDPSTRERMERYKEERRSMLRAKYKVEDYMTASSEVNNKYRKKSTESQQSNKTEQQTSEQQQQTPLAPFPVQEPPQLPVQEKCSSPVILRKESALKMSSPVREDGLIDEDVNVKERAAIFGGKTAPNNFQNNQNIIEKQNQNLPPKYNRSKSMWTNSSTAKVIKAPRPISDDSSNNGTSNRKISPGSPSKIRDMAAFFEQHQKN